MHQRNSLESLETNIYANFTCDKDRTKEQWGEKHSQVSKQKLPNRRKRERRKSRERERREKNEGQKGKKREKKNRKPDSYLTVHTQNQ